MKRLLALIPFWIPVTTAAAAQTSPSRPLGPELIEAVQTFFSYDPGIPLNARVVDSVEFPTYTRETIVFTGAHGDRVPAYLALPRRQARPERLPVAIVIHAGTGSKDSWWLEEGFERGRLVVDRLLSSEVAVLALDAQFHGARATTNDFESFRTMWFERQWFSWIRGGLVETVKDYRRALDYLSTRAEVDPDRIGLIGYSLGGIIGIYLAAFEPRIRTAVACVAALDEPWLYPIAPINVASRLERASVLLLAGRTDVVASQAKTDALYSHIPSSDKRLVYFDNGHRLPAAYADSAVSWIRARLH